MLSLADPSKVTYNLVIMTYIHLVNKNERSNYTIQADENLFSSVRVNLNKFFNMIVTQVLP